MTDELSPLKCWTTNCQTCKATFRYHQEQIKDSETSLWVECPACKRFTGVPDGIKGRVACK